MRDVGWADDMHTGGQSEWRIAWVIMREAGRAGRMPEDKRTSRQASGGIIAS